MRKVLVTGGCGFVGSALVKQLRKNPENYVTVIDKLTYAGHKSHIEDEADNLVIGDISDKKLVNELFDKAEGFDTVIHMAAESSVDKSIHDNDDFVITNILGTQNLLNAALRTETKLFLNMITDEVFGQLRADEEPFTESSPIKPRNPYSASKAGQYHIGEAFFHTHGLPVISAFASNAYGPRQMPEKLLPKMIHLLMNDQPLTIYGDGTNVRTWLYVDDFARALIHLINHGIEGERYIIGDINEKTNLEIINELGIALNKEPKITFIEDRKGHDFRYAVDTSKIQFLGWAPQKPLAEGIRDTVDWYLANKEWLETQYKKMSLQNKEEKYAGNN